MSLSPTNRQALSMVFGSPGIAVTVSFLALGILYSDSGFTLGQALGATAFVFALPAQVAHAELYAADTSLFAIGLTMVLINARFFPMAVSLFPLLHLRGTSLPVQYGLSHFMALTSWACFMSSYREVPLGERFVYYIILAAGAWILSMLATLAGYFLSGRLDGQAITAILILNPIYFACMILSAARNRAYFVAIALGMACYPALVGYFEDYIVLVCGFVGGAISYFSGRWSTKDD